MQNPSERTTIEDDSSQATVPLPFAPQVTVESFPCSPCRCRKYAEVLRDVSDAFAGVLSNAQVMDWKLPSYSRSKRYIHEIERNAQRGGELAKRLLRQLNDSPGEQGPADAELDQEIKKTACEVPPESKTTAVAATQEPSATTSPRVNQPVDALVHAAPVFSPGVRNPCSH